MDNCCKDVLTSHFGQSLLKTPFLKLHTTPQLVANLYISYAINSIEIFPENFNPFKHYIPPLLYSDIQALDEVFII